MIVQMKKVTVVVQAKDVEATLKVLAQAGVLHIEHQRAPRGENLTRLEGNLKSLAKAIEVLPDVQVPRGAASDCNKIAQQILNLLEEKEVITENLKKIKIDLEGLLRIFLNSLKR